MSLTKSKIAFLDEKRSELIKETDTEPGPTTYFPQNNLFGKTHPKAMLKYVPTPIVGYYYKTSVPIIERSYIKRANREPGPGRFDPPSAIGPTHRPGLEYWPDVFITDELERIKKYRRLPYKKYNLENYVEDANLRNIKGKGFTWLFKSPSLTSDNIVQKYKKRSTEKLFVRLRDVDYQTKVVYPQRNILSFRSEPIVYKVKPMELTTNREIKRRKAYENNKTAFSSGCGRWPDEKFVKKIVIKHRQDEIPKNPAYKNIESKFMAIPKKYKKTATKRVKYYKFAAEPTTKIVFDEATIGVIPKNIELTTQFIEIDINDYLLRK